MRKDRIQAQILNIKLDSTSEERVLELIQNKILKKHKFVILTPNPEIILAAQSDPELASILNSADLSIPDGVGLKLAAPNLTIIKGRHLMIRLFELAQKSKLKVFLFGATPQVNQKSVELIRTKYPQVKVQGDSGSHLDRQGYPVSDKDAQAAKETINSINKFKPNLLFVALGTPKEQKWIARHKNELNVNCIMEVGGALDYFSGVAKLPPAIFASLGLEWLWRLIHDPSRLGRIFNAVIVFPLKVILSKI